MTGIVLNLVKYVDCIDEIINRGRWRYTLSEKGMSPVQLVDVVSVVSDILVNYG